ncbi:hypothetical protein HBZ99_004083 [Salmonella enterica subsp. enterica]|uniref:Uncharacterized protein n=1 Tax=Salmonella enterica subsp. enterica serovar Java TaxID=224729 RepID=A0A3Z6QTG9_SALEB|nr:hypothetical protein [Salmonella enterica subsp. enterica serovar Java]EBK4665393.1 hypothetical protein [Salmonella enterica]ECA4660997.1 hypothetical protein [Salmonella enterica subsp. enterica serovar Cerro]EEP4266237.1 hypothetical protein [Salmonella enterica subsp. enterica serovar Oranienburg]HBM0024005.1 hypothetical protein [Salmonella enterica subsp. enterica serovar Muenchen]
MLTFKTLPDDVPLDFFGLACLEGEMLSMRAYQRLRLEERPDDEQDPWADYVSLSLIDRRLIYIAEYLSLQAERGKAPADNSACQALLADIHTLGGSISPSLWEWGLDNGRCRATLMDAAEQQ